MLSTKNSLKKNWHLALDTCLGFHAPAFFEEKKNLHCKGSENRGDSNKITACCSNGGESLKMYMGDDLGPIYSQKIK